MGTQLCVAFYFTQYCFCIHYQHVVTSGSYPLSEISHTSFGLLLVRTCVSLCPDADPVPDPQGGPRGRGKRTRLLARSAPWRWWPSWMMITPALVRNPF